MAARVDADVVEDEVWFARNRPRRYRVRATADGTKLLAVRKFNGGYFLRIHLGDSFPEDLDLGSERVAETLW